MSRPREYCAWKKTVDPQTVLGLNLALVCLILNLILLCFRHHAVNLRLRQATLLFGDVTKSTLNLIVNHTTAKLN